MRRPKPWFRTSKNAWYVQLNGLKVHLGDHPEHAPPPKKTKGAWNVPALVMDVYYRIMASDPAHLPKADRLLTLQICDLFLSHAERHTTRDTYLGYLYFLQSFSDAYGRIPAAQLKPIHVTRWLDDRPSWDGARRNAVVAVKRAFNWAEKQGVISGNPLRSIEKPPARRRTRILTPSEWEEILAAVPDQNFREFLKALYLTGCRPSEVARLTAANVNLDLGVWIFEKHKSAARTGKPRIVYLTPEMVAMSRRLIGEHPEGPLFPSRKLGRAFTRNAIRCRFRRLRQRLPHLKHFASYSIRHTYATDALATGIPVAQVAELLGHVGTRMLEQHYSHLDQKVKLLREAAEKVIR